MKIRREQGWEAYATEWAHRYGGYDPRRSQGVGRVWQRLAYRTGLRLFKLRVRPAAMTTLGLLVAVAVPVAAAGGRLLLAAVLVLVGGYAGAVGSALGVFAHGGARTGLVWESTTARLAEVCWLYGFWLAGVPSPLVLACGLVTGLHEYVRAQALAAGASRVGVHSAADRPARLPTVMAALLVAALASWANPRLAAGSLTVMSGLWLVLALLSFWQLIGALQRTPDQV